MYRSHVSVLMAVWLGLFTLGLPVVLSAAGAGHWGAVWADDDDGGDDDDDDDDGGAVSISGGSGDRSSPPAFVRGRDRARRTAAAPVVALPEFAAEIVVSDLSDADLAVLTAEGFGLIERQTIRVLAATLDRLSAPPGLTLTQARDRVRQLASGGDADFNHFYRTSQAATPTEACRHENCPAWGLVNWPAAEIQAGTCPVTQPIGVIDTGINPSHEILAGADLELLARPRATDGSSAVHGTAVVSLLSGNPASRVPGLLPGAKVLAVDVFSRASGDERADVADLVEGLDLLAARQVRIYNLSLSGPPNSVLARIIDRLTDAAGPDAVIVSAAGNGGPAAGAAWPGAHPMVLAVTAIDARGRVFAQAQRGDHLDLAAPGVNLLAATSVRGSRGKSGTSFAVPFVTAAAAVLLSRPADPPPSGLSVRATLQAMARDLGAVGKDPIFGAGLLAAGAICS